MNHRTKNGELLAWERCVGVRLGAFEIESILGDGAMGDVYGAVHVTTGAPVALKVMKERHGRKRAYQRAFRAEVQAVAGLDHPGIIMVLDHGEVDDNAENASGGSLQAGGIWFAMERASGGSLGRVDTPLPFETVKLLLLSLLDALAHAHARGVIHRDLKPANILLCLDSDVRPGLKLTDFGIAHAMSRRTRAESREGLLGTPQYMAPEQCRGDFRDYGPWTDLYALGCIAFELSCDHRPFDGKVDGKVDARELTRQHLEAPPPPLKMITPAPREFEGWVHRLLAKDPSNRFRRAADAAWALRFMQAPSEVGGVGAAVPTTPVPLAFDDATEVDAPPAQKERGFSAELIGLQQTLAVDPLRVRETGRFSHAAVGEVIDSQLLKTVEGPMHRDVPPMQVWQAPPLPDTWRRSQQEPALRLQDAGERLFGVRTVPLVGRDRERDLLWDDLIDVSQAGSARAAVVRGPAGLGKSYLVEWIVQRAHELGNAVVLKSVHSPMGGPADGLPRTIAEFLGSHGLATLGVQRRVERVLGSMGMEDPYDLSAIAEVVLASRAPKKDPGLSSVRLRTPMERYVVLARLLQYICLARPTLLILDDAQWGADALAFALHLLDMQAERPIPVLIIAIVEDDALKERTLESGLIADLLDRPNARSISLGPLSEAESHELVGELLGLDPALEQGVLERAAGNPLFAIQLVADWIERGVLARGDRGFRLIPGAKVELPDDIFTIWSGRIDRLLAEWPPESQFALEVAAALGMDVDIAEWTWACHRVGSMRPSAFADDLVAAGLASRMEGEVVVLGGMLRDTIIRRCREGGRWSYVNRVCADMLAELHAADVAMVGERLGNHLLEAGAAGESFAPFLVAARQRSFLSEFETAHGLLNLRERVLRENGVAKTDVAWAAGWAVRARVLSLVGEVEEGRVWAERAVVSARRCGAAEVLRDALAVHGRILYRQGRPKDSERVFEQALVAFEAAGDDVGVANCLRNLGNIANTIKNVAAEEEFYHQALDLYEKVGDDLGMGMTFKSLGIVYRQRGDLARAKRMHTKALPYIERSGSRLELARLLNGVAEIARAQGKLNTAEKGYRQALKTYEDVGSRESVVPMANLGMVRVMRGDFEAGRHLLQRGLEMCERAGLLSFVHHIRAALLPCAAAGGDTAAFDHHYTCVETLLADSGVKDNDVAAMAELAGDVWTGVDNARARLAFELSMVQWRWLGRDDDVSRVERAIARLN